MGALRTIPSVGDATRGWPTRLRALRRVRPRGAARTIRLLAELLRPDGMAAEHGDVPLGARARVALLPGGVTLVRYAGPVAATVEIVGGALDELGTRLRAATAALAGVPAVADLAVTAVAGSLAVAAFASGDTTWDQLARGALVAAGYFAATPLRVPALRWLLRRVLTSFLARTAVHGA